MTIKATHEIAVERLRAELRALGMDARGSRSELVSLLQQAGIYEINDSIPPRPMKIDRTTNFPNHNSILIGHGAKIHDENEEKLVICNSGKSTPIIEGDFTTSVVSIHNCLQLKESVVNTTVDGNEGDIRREGSQLYMYRSTGVHEGWYPLQFGPVVIV